MYVHLIPYVHISYTIQYERQSHMMQVSTYIHTIYSISIVCIVFYLCTQLDSIYAHIYIYIYAYTIKISWQVSTYYIHTIILCHLCELCIRVYASFGHTYQPTRMISTSVTHDRQIPSIYYTISFCVLCLTLTHSTTFVLCLIIFHQSAHHIIIIVPSPIVVALIIAVAHAPSRSHHRAILLAR